MAKLVVLDAGHGGKDVGAVGNGYYEKNVVLDFTKRVGAHLTRSGVRVEYTRTGDTFIDLTPRAQFANRLNADYFVSFHENSNGGDPGTGFESFVQLGYANTDTDRKRLVIHRKMAAVAAKYGLRDRGAKSKDLAVTRETTMDAALIELLFINNPQDAKLNANQAFLNEMAEAAARGICEVVGVAFVDVPKPVAPVVKPAPARFPLVTKAAADVVIAELGALWNRTSDKAVKDAAHFAAEALRKEAK